MCKFREWRCRPAEEIGEDVLDEVEEEFPVASMRELVPFVVGFSQWIDERKVEFKLVEDEGVDGERRRVPFHSSFCA